MVIFLEIGFGIELRHQPLKSLVYFGLLGIAPTLFVISLYNLNRKPFFGGVLSLLVLLGIGFQGPLNIVFASSIWKTQKILKKLPQFPNQQIELQFQDVGAFGYNRRTVKATYFAGVFMKVREVKNETLK
ncbi:hypothetical protein BWZ20_04545 [Winogradskyella sp. J14-2]|nr:hypothetical protein BWZ20_04545 [Winogradskyella sp. J14-2]